MDYILDISSVRLRQVELQEHLDRKLKELSGSPECNQAIMALFFAEREYSRYRQREHVKSSIWSWPKEFANYTQSQIDRQERLLQVKSCEELQKFVKMNFKDVCKDQD